MTDTPTRTRTHECGCVYAFGPRVDGIARTSPAWYRTEACGSPEHRSAGHTVMAGGHLIGLRGVAYTETR